MKLLDVCRTRWVAKIDGLNIFIDLLPAIVAALEKICFNIERKYNRDTSSTAVSLLHLVLNFQFIVALVICKNVLNYLRPLTVKLQSKDQDILRGYEMVKVLCDTLKHVINEVDTKHEVWYNEALEIAESLQVNETTQRS